MSLDEETLLDVSQPSLGALRPELDRRGWSSAGPLSTTSRGTALRYDSLSGQFVQNWQTSRTMAGNCYSVTMTTQDGSFISARFKIK